MKPIRVVDGDGDWMEIGQLSRSGVVGLRCPGEDGVNLTPADLARLRDWLTAALATPKPTLSGLDIGGMHCTCRSCQEERAEDARPDDADEPCGQRRARHGGAALRKWAVEQAAVAGVANHLVETAQELIDFVFTGKSS
jgi:hypothetical protein